MAALVGWRRVVLAFIVALIVGSVLGSLVQTQFNLQALEGLGVEISMATRLQTTVQDLLNFAPLYAILFGLSFLFSQGAASLVARLAGQSHAHFDRCHTGYGWTVGHAGNSCSLWFVVCRSGFPVAP